MKVIGRDSWITLLPSRLYRAVPFREGGDVSPFRSLRATVEHEALCALKAHADHVPTPRLRAITELRPGAMLATDVAEVLAGTSSRLGVQQAVAAAVKAVGADAVATCLPACRLWH